MKKLTSKVIRSPQLATYLLQAGYTIIDLKPKHDAPKETVFVFRIDNGFFEAMETWVSEDGYVS